jgi:hypothetical protein
VSKSNTPQYKHIAGKKLNQTPLIKTKDIQIPKRLAKRNDWQLF